jgi:hypothetical protein
MTRAVGRPRAVTGTVRLASTPSTLPNTTSPDQQWRRRIAITHERRNRANGLMRGIKKT